MVHKGQRYRARRALQVSVLSHYRAPCTGGAIATLPAGEVFTVAVDPPPHATAASCDPDRYEALQAELVPQEDRDAHNYSGYSLVVNLEAIETDCELVS